MGQFTGIAAATGLAGLLYIGRLFYMDKAIDIMARTAYGEARGEGPQGMQAVCHVIMNRANLNGWMGGTVVGVALKPQQFSAWNKDDPNRAIIEAVDDSDPVFAQALQIAAAVYGGEVEDITNGATHYHASWVNPYWADSNKIVAQVGDHTFYEGIA